MKILQLFYSKSIQILLKFIQKIPQIKKLLQRVHPYNKGWRAGIVKTEEGG